ncbi:MAG: hypothetical protein JWP89_603 [Schlesneria sp.]|nr:hypothetical protein [Schlesneria sp.]
MKPTVKDLSQFVAAALGYDLLSLSEVVAWGDEVIASNDQPPTWALDLAMASDLEAIGSTLRQMEWRPDCSTPLTTERLLVGLLRRHWINGKVDDQKAASLLWQILLMSDQESAFGQFIDIESVRKLHYREYLDEFPHCDDIPWQLNQIFTSCSSLAELLPAWI